MQVCFDILQGKYHIAGNNAGHKILQVYHERHLAGLNVADFESHGPKMSQNGYLNT